MTTSNTLILGTHKGLMILRQNGADWQPVCETFLGIPVSYAMQDHRTGLLWAGLDHGHWGTKLHRSRDGGATWEEIPAPKYPEGAVISDGGPPGFSDGKTKPASTSYLWLIAPGGDDEPERLYIGTEPGGLFASDDSGDTFALVDGLWNHPSRESWWFGGGRDQPGLCSIVVDPRDSRRVLAGISVGGVFESTDGGATWAGRNMGLKANYLPDPASEYGHDPHFMIASPANPDVLWQQNHCGVFRSTDGGQTWADVSQEGGPVYFGFAVAPDAQDPDVAWVVPAISDELRIPVDGALCVCRTDDGGKTWQDFRAGLPQKHSYDLVFRHALDISGDRLAFGTTTGNLYLSGDRGESWTCLTNHLPPIYSVRFA